MKKSLMATVAAVALIADASMASAAEGTKEQPGMKAGAAVKAEPEMKKGADIKAGAAMKGRPETNGAGVESSSEMKSEPKAGMKPDSKAGAKADNKAKADKANADRANADKAKPSTTGQGSDQKAAPAAKSSASEKAAPAAKPSTQGSSTQGAGATPNSQAGASSTSSQTGSSVSLTTEQKSKIRTSVLQSSSAPKVSRSSINFNISVGTVIPRSGVRFVTVPETLIEVHPAWRGYSYFVVDEQIIIIDPSTFRIVAILDV